MAQGTIRVEILERIRAVAAHFKVVELTLFDSQGHPCKDGDEDIHSAEILFADGQKFFISIEEVDALGKHPFKMGIDFQ